MFAFIYIIYLIIALLYKIVLIFKDTWIECFNNLGRYRIIIKNNDIRGREV